MKIILYLPLLLTLSIWVLSHYFTASLSFPNFMIINSSSGSIQVMVTKHKIDNKFGLNNNKYPIMMPSGYSPRESVSQIFSSNTSSLEPFKPTLSDTIRGDLGARYEFGTFVCSLPYFVITIFAILVCTFGSKLPVGLIRRSSSSATATPEAT